MDKPGRPRKEGDDRQMKRWAKDRRRKKHQTIYGEENKKTPKQAEAVRTGQSAAPADNEDGQEH
jgi:hypothetical protein